MRKTMIFIMMLCLTVQLSAQTTLSGTVYDTTDGQQPLAFATVAVAGKPYGTLSLADGSFILNSKETLPPETRIIVSYLGYSTEEFRLADWEEGHKVLLSRDGIGLPTISVAATGNLTEIELGRRERKARVFYQSIFEQTFQLATRVENPEQRAGILTEIRYYFGRAAKKGKPVRLNFYAADPACGCPGAPLHATSIIPQKNKSGWNKLDLTSYQVSLPAGDFFVAYEWLGLSSMKVEGLNFSVGMIYDKSAAKIFEKVGGADWEEATDRTFYRPLVRVSGKVED